MDVNFPIWLSGKAKSVAETLLKDGFWYCGKSDDFCTFEKISEESMEVAGDWLIGGAYQEIAIDAICDGALFTKDLDEDCNRAQFETELNRIKQLIIQAEFTWDSASNVGQLDLFESLLG